MELGDYLALYRKEANLTIDELASKSGIPKGTINKIIAGTTKSPTLETVQRLAAALGKTINDFVAPQTKKEPPYSSEALKLAEDYDQRMGKWGRKQVRSVADIEVARYQERQTKLIRSAMQFSQQAQPEADLGDGATQMVEKLVYLNPAAAGTPLYAESDFERWAFPEDQVPKSADFGIRISGKSMEPTVQDGAIVWVHKTLELANGTVGVFMINDSAVCKRFFKNEDGTVRLESDNPRFGPVQLLEADTFMIVGEVVGAAKILTK